jgi:hypothetical protein
MTDNTITQKQKRKWTNNNLQNNTRKTRDRTTRTALKPGGVLRYSKCGNGS